MKFERMYYEHKLVTEECPICKQKGFLQFVMIRHNGMYNTIFVVTSRDTAEAIECSLCKAVYYVPDELVVKK